MDSHVKLAEKKFLKLSVDREGQYLLPFPFEGVSKQAYLAAHKKLMDRLRKQTIQKNIIEIEKTGRQLCRLRKKYRQYFAA